MEKYKFEFSQLHKALVLKTAQQNLAKTIYSFKLMTYRRTYQDLIGYNPLMKNVYYEYEKKKKNDPQPRIQDSSMVKYWSCLMNHLMLNQVSLGYFEWSAGISPEMKLWDEKLRFTLGRMQGGY